MQPCASRLWIPAARRASRNDERNTRAESCTRSRMPGDALPSPMPSDIDPQSGFRLPLRKREDLDEAGQARLRPRLDSRQDHRRPARAVRHSSLQPADGRRAQRDEPVSALSGASTPRPARSRSSPSRAKWTANSNGPRTSPKLSKRACRSTSSTSSNTARARRASTKLTRRSSNSAGRFSATTKSRRRHSRA